jgi:hypothetical protein
VSGELDTCKLCGGRPYAPVTASWTITLKLDAPLQNNHLVNAGNSRWKYKKERQFWETYLVLHRVNNGIPVATSRRRVTIERLYSGQQRECDLPNLVGGCKTVLDAMVRAGLLVDDSPAHFEGYFRQERVAKEHRGTRITIEELA